MAAPTDLVQLGHNRGQARLPMAQSIWRLDAKLGRPLDINRAYADYASQMRYYLEWTAFKANPSAWRRANPGRSDPPLALHPDQSWHCKGMAIDTDDRLGQRFLDAGFRFVVTSEPWHGQYYANLDKHYGQPSSGGSIPFPIPRPAKDDTIMELVIKAPNGIVVHLAPGIKHDFASSEEYTLIAGDLEFIRERKGTDAMKLPPLADVVGVSWDSYKRFCAYFNVPTEPGAPV